MNRLHNAIIGAALALFAVTGATPLTAAPQQEALTLTRAVEEALAGNRRLAVAAAAVDEADAGARQARAARLPRVDLSYVYQRTDNPVLVFGNLLRQGHFSAANFAVDELNDPDAIDNFTPSVSVVQPIWTGGRIARRREAAELVAEAAGWRQERTRQQVVYDTVEAYSAAVLATRTLAVAEDSLATAGAHVALAESMSRAGMVVDSDVLQARVRESEAREARARARSGLAVAETALNLVIGRALTAPLTLPDDVDEPRPLPEGLEALVAEALAARPDLRAAAVQEAATGRSLDAERAGLLPEVAASGFAEANGGTMFGSPSANWGVTIGATFTAFDGNGRAAAVDQKLAQRRQIEQQVLLLRRAVALEVTRAFHDVQAAAESIVPAEAAVGLARESLRIVENRYREGMAAAVELLDAQTQLTGAQTRVVAAHRDLMIGRAALDLAVGR